MEKPSIWQHLASLPASGSPGLSWNPVMMEPSGQANVSLTGTGIQRQDIVVGSVVVITIVVGIGNTERNTECHSQIS